jgi:thiol-disulfide isomerase/thioredoxin
MQPKNIRLLAFTVLIFAFSNFNVDACKAQAIGQPGSQAANFTATDINGKSVRLNDFKGKYILLDFWASWCVPCRQASPHLLGLYHKYNAKGFDIIGISDDDTRLQQWHNAVKTDSTAMFHQILRGAGKKSATNARDLHKAYNIQSLPTKILVDPSGKIIGRYGDNDTTTDDDLDKVLVAAFKY